MTEYDYSPAAYQRYVEHLGKVADWVADTNSCSRFWRNPFLPSPTIRRNDFYDSPDDDWEHVTFADQRGRPSQSHHKPAIDPRLLPKHPPPPPPPPPNPPQPHSHQRSSHHRTHTPATVPQAHTQHKSRRSQSVPVANPPHPPRYAPEAHPFSSQPRRNTFPTTGRHHYPLDPRYVDPFGRPVNIYPAAPVYPYRLPRDPPDQFHQAHSRSPDKVQPQSRYTVPHGDHRKGSSGQTYHTAAHHTAKQSSGQNQRSIFKRLYDSYKRTASGPKPPWPSQAYY